MFALRYVRKFTTSAVSRAAASAEGKAADGGHHANPTLWRNMTIFVAFPATVACMINAYIKEKEHWDHPEHARPPFIKYEYLRRRTKPFPWGDGNHTLLHNPWKNALPEGYETEFPEHDHGHEDVHGAKPHEPVSQGHYLTN